MMNSRAIWEAAERRNLYARGDDELEAVIAKHGDPVTAAAASYILDLRRWMAAGPPRLDDGDRSKPPAP
jgi:hypothetical protein